MRRETNPRRILCSKNVWLQSTQCKKNKIEKSKEMEWKGKRRENDEREGSDFVEGKPNS